jgi:hypothetical protein
MEGSTMSSAPSVYAMITSGGAYATVQLTRVFFPVQSKSRVGQVLAVLLHEQSRCSKGAACAVKL